MPGRIVFLGTRGLFSRLPFEALLAAGFPVVGMIIPSQARVGLPGEKADAVRAAPRPGLPMWPADAVGLALAREIPVLEVARLNDPASLAALAGLRPDVLCAACFPRRLPPAWLALPARGALNVHPSLLPAYRGPEPLFWQFRAGEARTGVSVHCMDAGLDTGDLVAQTAVPLPDGVVYADAERRLAEAGAELLVAALKAETWPRAPQPSAGASRFPLPSTADLDVPTDWPARRAYNFLRGAAPWGPFTLIAPERRWRAQTALRYLPETAGAALPPAGSGTAWVEFTPGAVEIQLA